MPIHSDWDGQRERRQGQDTIQLLRDMNLKLDRALEQLASHETTLRYEFGNGQPGRVPKSLSNAFDRIRSLETWRWMIVGGIAALSFMVGFAATVYSKAK